MPKVTLYVRDEDQPVWARAHALAAKMEDSLSAIVTEALRRYLDQKEREHAARAAWAGKMQPVELRVDHGAQFTVRFTGTRLATLRQQDGKERTVYLTAAGKLVYYEQLTEDVGAYEVFDSFDALQHALVRSEGPMAVDEFLARVAEALGTEFVLHID